MLHGATLIHDDLIDEAETRRGRPALHAAFGRDVALLVGDMYVARCGVHCANTRWPGAGGELFGALSVMVGGELGQRARRFDLEQTADGYLNTIRLKTSTLIEAACAAACWIALGDDDQSGLPGLARQYGDHLGRAFQLVDDVLDFAGDEAALGKPVGNDIREGTVTLPLIWALEMSPAPVREIVASARARDDYSAVIQAVRRSGAVERCLELADQESREAVQALEDFPDHPARRALEELATSLPHRLT
jgi:geranylgeranyl pyrophosphate synthase